MNKMDEQILVIKRDELFHQAYDFQGFSNDLVIMNNFADSLSNKLEVMRRGDAETDINYKQPIPYMLVMVGDKFFAYERLSNSGESRLHNKLSMGIGGHMNPLADQWESNLYENIYRELNEELHIESDESPQIEILGYINDELDEVGKVHIGILGLIKYKNGVFIEVKETDQLAGGLYSAEQLLHQDNYNRLENWSKIVLTELLF